MSNGLRLKTYAKSQGLLRLELMIRTRDGVRRLVQHGGGTDLPASSTPSGDQAVAELRALHPVAAGHLDGLWQHVVEVPSLNRSHIEFLVAMSPLLSVLFRPDDKAGAQLSPDNVEKTYDAIFQLMALGEYSPFQNKGQPLRDALEMMAKGADALLQRSPGRIVHFVVRKEWAEARLAVVRMLG